ncbi:glycosyltransferase [Gillisia sp. CAL575]|uniref:glycosyltransferase n=1 Tax=Gillisia sp. CAL575 TaxID=985255 RepID=UPI0003A1E3F9|nr:glycosyltransferase [Gillisia sp. CAL575]
MQKIKVLHIIKSLGRGGAETLLPETLKLHNSEKFEFHYIYFLPWKDQMVDAIEVQGGKVTCLAASNNLKLLQQYPAVINYCKKHAIDLIHCHLPWSGFLGRIVYAKTKIPVIYTEHNIQERYHIITKLLNKSTFNSQSIALGVSKDVSRSIKQHIKPKIPIQTLLNGVNTDKFTRNPLKAQSIRDQYGIPEEAVVIGNIAVFREQKCIPDWLNAFKKISDKNNNTYGLLVGAGPLETEIKTLVKELKLEKNVILPGLQTDTVSYFSAMDIFMMSSAFEGLPIALLEAMSMQCAVISTRAGGVVEVVRDSKDGLLCDVGDTKNMADLAVGLLNDKDKRVAFQNAARARVVDSFSLTNMVSELEKVYTKCNEV